MSIFVTPRVFSIKYLLNKIGPCSVMERSIYIMIIITDKYIFIIRIND